MKGTEPIKIEEPFKDDDKVYYVNGGRCSGKVDKTINELVNYIDNLQQENKQLEEHIEKYEHYCKTTGIEELMKENQKYKEVIDKAIEKLEEVKERRILRLLEMEVLEILKEVE